MECDARRKIMSKDKVEIPIPTILIALTKFITILINKSLVKSDSTTIFLLTPLEIFEQIAETRTLNSLIALKSLKIRKVVLIVLYLNRKIVVEYILLVFDLQWLFFLVLGEEFLLKNHLLSILHLLDILLDFLYLSLQVVF